ncbi:MAG: hypothetical protein RLZZ165_2460, partial [Bacteroidota bacterium]
MRLLTGFPGFTGSPRRIIAGIRDLRNWPSTRSMMNPRPFGSFRSMACWKRMEMLVATGMACAAGGWKASQVSLEAEDPRD